MRRRGRSEQPDQDARPAPRDWATLFPGDASREAYRVALRAHTPAAWEIVESGQADLLKLLAGRVPAEVGVGVILGLAVLFANHPKGDAAGLALLSTVVREVDPGRARTLLVTLADAWETAQHRAWDARAVSIRADLLRAARRLLATDLPPAEREALTFVAELLA